jgi:crotonobetaine/carnitine-CoA ligase
MDSYYRMPQETLQATRNLWFHTGDLARADDDGFLYFVGRRTDSIRRRGENISAFEIEEAISLHPDVLEVAAYGVASELSEEDVMVAIVARPDRRIDPVDLVAFCETTMARHMVPRYVDIVDALPKTPTEKVEKYRLAARGLTTTTWDRERVILTSAGDENDDKTTDQAHAPDN